MLQPLSPHQGAQGPASKQFPFVEWSSLSSCVRTTEQVISAPFWSLGKQIIVQRPESEAGLLPVSVGAEEGVCTQLTGPHPGPVSRGLSGEGHVCNGNYLLGPCLVLAAVVVSGSQSEPDSFFLCLMDLPVKKNQDWGRQIWTSLPHLHHWMQKDQRLYCCTHGSGYGA